jgi:hypothetical protein
VIYIEAPFPDDHIVRHGPFGTADRQACRLRAGLGQCTLDAPLTSRIDRLAKKRDELAYYLTEHLRMNGIYWGLTALCLMRRQDALPRQAMLDWVMSCYDPQRGQSALVMSSLYERSRQEGSVRIQDTTCTSTLHSAPSKSWPLKTPWTC